MDGTRTQASRAAGHMALGERDALDDEIEGALVDGHLVEEEVPGFDLDALRLQADRIARRS